MDIILKQQETISRKQTVPRETLERNNCVRSTLLFGLAFAGSWRRQRYRLLQHNMSPTHTTVHTEQETNKTRTTWRELNVIQTAKQLKAVTLPRTGKDLIVPRVLMV